MIDKKGFVYNKLSEKIGYNNEMKRCIETTVENLINVSTSSSKPGMLLGKIQSGKTRAFIGTIGLAFDNGYDVAIVLTKGTRALAEQTFQRLNKDFSEMIENDIVQIFDIMHLADNLRPYELNQKIIFIVKKEVHNLDRLQSSPSTSGAELNFEDLKFLKEHEGSDVVTGIEALALSNNGLAVRASFDGTTLLTKLTII